MSKPEEPRELQPSTRAIESCGICHPPEDIGMNHRPLPRLLDIIAQAYGREAKR